MATIDLAGAADLHCHFGPDAHRERSVDALLDERAIRCMACDNPCALLGFDAEPAA
jgi:hypothetical protein